MKNLLHRFAMWLWSKTYQITATEIMMFEGQKREFNRKCWKCGERIYPLLPQDKEIKND